MCVSSMAALPAGGARAAASERQPAARPAGTARTVLSFTFDDGDADQMAAARVLHRYGMDGTFYIITGAVGAPHYVTLADLHTLASDGDEIGGHTVSHLELPHVSAAEARRQVCDGRNILIRWGFRPASFAYPGGAYSPATEVMVRKCGFNNARIVIGLRSPGCPACAVAESIPAKDPYAVRVPGQVDGSWTLATLEGVVTTAERRGGGWLPLVFHHICATKSCSSLSVRLSLVNSFAKWLAQRRGVGTVVKTVGQVVGGPLRPAISAPAAPRHGVINPSLETLGSSGAVEPAVEAPIHPVPAALCWMRADYGQNTTAWRRIRGGHHSPWAFRMTMISHRSGDAKLIQQFDTGECAIPVLAGHSYNLAIWYKSTTTSQFSVYYRTPAGRWLYWASSPFFPATRPWADATWTTPPVPAGASGLSFGLTLSRPGSLITDDYRILATQPSLTRGILDIAVLTLLAVGGAVAGTRARRRRRRKLGGLGHGPQALANAGGATP